MNLTIEFTDIADLRRKLRELNSAVQAENLTLSALHCLHSREIKDVRMDERIRKGLLRSGFKRLQEVSELSKKEFLKIPSLGRKALFKMNLILQEYKLSTIN